MRGGALVVASIGMVGMLPVAPASAEVDTSVTISSTTMAGDQVDVTGALALGTDATAPMLLADDPRGDAALSNAGLDFGKVTVTADPTARRLTYRIEVFDMPPAVDLAPFFGYIAPFAVDGADDAQLFLAAGNAGANFPPSTGKFWALCNSVAGYVCNTPLTGTLANGVVTIVLPYGQVGPGSVVTPGGALGGGCPGLCSTAWAVLLFGNFGGDFATPAGFSVPGGVHVGLAPAGTPIEDVLTDTAATVDATGAWRASLPKPAPGDHIVVARSCFGNIDAPVCAVSSAPLVF